MPERFQQTMPDVESGEEERKSQLEKIREFKKWLLDQARKVFSTNGVDYNEDRVEKRIMELNPLKEGENNWVFDIEARLDEKPVSLRLVGPFEQDFNPDREKDYEEWDLTPREEGIRQIQREIIVNVKLPKFYEGEPFWADEVVDSNDDPKRDEVFILKSHKEQTGNPEAYGEEEGRAITQVLLLMQEDLKATEMIHEIMQEQKIKSTKELEQKIFEDIINDWQGYRDDSDDILEETKHGIKHQIIAARENYRNIIEGRQLVGPEYSLVYNNCYLENIIRTKDGKFLLADWKKTGITQNRELALIWDLGELMSDKIETTTSLDNIKAFIQGVEQAVKEYYEDNPRVGEALINLAKFRSFIMIVDNLEPTKQDYVLGQIEQAIRESESK